MSTGIPEVSYFGGKRLESSNIITENITHSSALYSNSQAITSSRLLFTYVPFLAFFLSHGIVQPLKLQESLVALRTTEPNGSRSN
jgi:hypothetical protein